MPAEVQYEAVLQTALTEVLETMFFASVGGEIPTPAGPDALMATLRFVGQPSGSFSLAVSREAAEEMAAGFLGFEDEVTPGQPAEVIREMANMVCGSFLSKVESDTHFELSSPQTPAEFPPEAWRCSFELENGSIEVGLTTLP